MNRKSHIRVFQAVGRGIHPTSLDKWTDEKKKDYMFLRLKDDSSIDLNEKKKMILQSEGIKYGYLDLLVHAIYILTFKGIWIGSTGEKAKKVQVCSEFVAYIYEEYFSKPWKVTTDDIVKKNAFRVLDYDEELQTGDIAIEHTYFSPFNNPVSILSIIIRWFTRSYWNHCGIVVR